jgi:hypothetical protein
MDPFERQFRGRRNVNYNAIIAFVIGVLVAYMVQRQFSFGGGNLFMMLIVVAVGGLWYHLRRIV